MSRIKCLKIAAILLCVSPLFAQKPVELARISIDGTNDGIIITNSSVCGGGMLEPCSWGPEEKRKQIMTFILPSSGKDWKSSSLRFTPDKDGQIILSLLGPYVKENNKLKRINVLFDNVTVEGSAIKNGDFEAAGKSAAAPQGWELGKTPDGDFARYLPRSRKRGIDGTAAVMVWTGGMAYQLITVKKDVPVTITAMTRMAGADDVAAAMTDSAFVETENDKKYKNLPAHFVDLASVANMGFADEKAGDGIGGWSDQGPDNDFRTFDVHQTQFGGMEFKIADPVMNGGHAIITLFNGKFTAKIEPPAKPAARFLYLLHTTTYNSEKKGSRIGTINITLAGGKTVTREVLSGVDVMDWWNPGYLENASVVVKKVNPNSTVGIYLSKFDISDIPAEVSAIEFQSSGKAVWIITGATLSSRNMPLPTLPKVIFKEDAQWKPIDMSNVQIVSGSALDFSSMSGAGQAGQYGRAVINDKGQVVFEKQPDKAVHFLAFNQVPSWLMNYPEMMLAGTTDQQTKSNIEQWAALVKRQGYSMVRFQNIDDFLMRKAKAPAEFDPVVMDRFDYILACLKRNGIYTFIDIMSYYGFEKGGLSWDVSEQRRWKEMIFFDKSVREMWKAGMIKIMKHVNPYTGMSLADDPALVGVTFLNEQDIPVETKLFKDDPVITPEMTKRWQQFLQKKYGTIAALEKAWNTDKKRLPQILSFDQVPFLEQEQRWEIGPRGNDAGTFLIELQAEMLGWYERAIRETGFKGFTTQYDVMGYFRSHALRNLNQAVAMHSYGNHPSKYSDPGSVMPQDSIMSSYARYFRTNSDARYLNRPLFNLEYACVFWGKYRHEEGLLFPAYSALQKFSAITLAHQPVIMRTAQPMLSFYHGRDPVARAGQVLAAMLYQRGDVAPSPHTTAMIINDRYIFSNGNMNRTMNSEQSKIALLSGFGLQYEGAVPKGLPPYRKADMVVFPAEGGGIVDVSQWAASVVESGSSKGIDPIIARMKSLGILSADNISSGTDGILQSDTREITLYSKQKRLTVITPRTEGVCMMAGEKAALKNMTVENTSISATVALTSLDGATLPESRRMLLIYSTDAVNTGLETSGDRTTLFNIGKLPILVETGKLTLAINTADAASKKIWALALDGSRKEEITPLSAGSGTMKIEIDTAALKKGPAFFFEIADK